MKKYLLILFFANVLFLQACGYELAIKKRILSSNINKICVQLFSNNTNLSGFEVILTNDLINELLKRGINCLNNCDNADAAIFGKILSSQINAVSKTSLGQSLEKQILINVDLNVKDKNDNILLNNAFIQDSESFQTSDDFEISEQNKDNAVNKLSQKLAEKIFSQLVQPF